MALYTERNGMRKPIERTSAVTVEMYSLLLDLCQKYYKHLTYLFQKKCHDDFTAKDYLVFGESQFINRLKIKIPTLFRDEYGGISSPDDGDTYDQYALLDLIEFIAQNAKDISEGWNSQRYQNYWNIVCLNTSNVFDVYRSEINEIFIESGLLYTLTPDKVIERVVENSVLSIAFESTISKVNDLGTRELLIEAITLYKQPHPQEHRKAVEKIWDALESLKTHFPGIEQNRFDEKLATVLGNEHKEIEAIFKKELNELGNIGNNYSIRHFNDKQVAVVDERHCDYFFNRCLALIATATKYL